MGTLNVHSDEPLLRQGPSPLQENTVNKDITSVDTEAGVKELLVPRVTDTPAENIMKAIQERKSQEYTFSLMHYLETGDMPNSFYRKLPVSTQRYYRQKFIGKPGHSRGRPLTATELKAVAQRRTKTRKADKVSRLARKRNQRARRAR